MNPTPALPKEIEEWAEKEKLDLYPCTEADGVNYSVYRKAQKEGFDDGISAGFALGKLVGAAENAERCAEAAGWSAQNGKSYVMLRRQFLEMEQEARDELRRILEGK